MPRAATGSTATTTGTKRTRSASPARGRSASPARGRTASKSPTRGRSASPAAKRAHTAAHAPAQRTPASRSTSPARSATGVDRSKAAQKAAKSRSAADKKVAGKRAARTRQVQGTVAGHTHEAPKNGKQHAPTHPGPKSLAEFKKELEDYTVEELKEMLRYNKDRPTGTKMELVNRVADRMLHGPLPKCPKCKKGYLHWHPRNCNWRCAGYFDVDHVHPCGHEEDDPVRGEWHQPADIPVPAAAHGSVTLDKPHGH